jgi:hypothetical protein
MNLRTKLAALFCPTRSLIGSEADVVQPGGAFGGRQWIVPRAQLQYRRLDLSNLTSRQRGPAAQLATARHLPSPGSRSHLAWSGGIAHLWIWSPPASDVVDAQARWIPESLLRPASRADGPRLLAMVEGYEGQVWSQGVLASSQWWPLVPDAEAWRRFVRAAGLEAEANEVPAPLQAGWAAPWAEQRLDLAAAGGAGRERMAWIAVAAVLALALGWQLTGLLRWHNAGEQLARDLEMTRAQLAPVLSARERAEAAQAEAQRLRGLQVGASDYALTARVITRLPQGSSLKSWVREPDKLTVKVGSSLTDPRLFVAAFAQDPELAQVSATPQSSEAGVMLLEFDLTATREATP